jgi:hypothetical protein
MPSVEALFGSNAGELQQLWQIFTFGQMHGALQ